MHRRYYDLNTIYYILYHDIFCEQTLYAKIEFFRETNWHWILCTHFAQSTEWERKHENEEKKVVISFKLNTMWLHDLIDVFFRQTQMTTTLFEILILLNERVRAHSYMDCMMQITFRFIHLSFGVTGIYSHIYNNEIISY